ncbi:MAG: four-carbon acid sugar kinase family protein [Clostridiales bacterium]|nr:four-carbon acid sugar kinase family protein [Clostridiales bacterium]
MIELLVIADDFTGALDTGVQFGKRGLKTLVVKSAYAGSGALDESVRVLCVDAETRHLSREDAYRAVRRLAAWAAGLGVTYIYKKTDSALRGNIGSELLAAMDGAGADRLMFVPAFPEYGRVTEGGVHYVGGVPVSLSSFAHDPFEPVNNSFVPDIIKTQADVVTTVIRRGGRPDIHGQRGICVFDAATDEDLVDICAALKETGSLSLTAGCAGFAAALARALAVGELPAAADGALQTKTKARIQDVSLPDGYLPGSFPPVCSLPGSFPPVCSLPGSFPPGCFLPGSFPSGGCVGKPGGRVLLVSGSLHEATVGQMQYAKAKGFAGVSLTAEQKLEPDFHLSAECGQLAREIRAILGSGKPAYIEGAAGAEDAALCRRYALERGLSAEPMRIAENIGRITKRILETAEPANLFVIGGDTLAGILGSLGNPVLMPVAELLPGVALSKIVGGRYGFDLITKAGGFGPPDTAVAVASMLNRKQVTGHGVRGLKRGDL